MATKGNGKSLERHEQSTLVAWFRIKYPHELLFAIPNGGSRNILEAVNLKKSGVVAGMPDLMLAVARVPWHGMFIEMKRLKGGKVSAQQQQIADLLRDKGYMTVVAKGFDDAKLQIEGYLTGEPWMARTDIIPI